MKIELSLEEIYNIMFALDRAIIELKRVKPKFTRKLEEFQLLHEKMNEYLNQKE